MLKTVTAETSKRIFLAGAGGVIGRSLLPLLIQDGWQVFGTTRSTEKAATIRARGAEPVIVDVFDADALLEAVGRIQPVIVIHQLTDLPPGLDPARMKEARVRNAHLREIGTRNLVAAAHAAGVRRMVAQSIAFAYAPGDKPYREEAPLNVDDPEAGLSARAVASLEQQVLNGPFEGVVLRYGKLYGPGTGFGTPPPGGPLHIDDAALAARWALSAPVGIYNISEQDGTVSCAKAIASGWTPQSIRKST